MSTFHSFQLVRQKRLGILAILVAFLAPLSALAQNNATDYPSKPIKILTPWPPGGANDILAREIGNRLSAEVKQPVYIDNRGGTNGSIGAEVFAKSAPDGYTVMVHSVTSHATNPSFYQNLRYDTYNDFQLVTLITAIPQIIVTNLDFPAKTLTELVSMAKAAPGKISYASYGNGSPSHLSGELFKAVSKTNLTHVPYKGGGPALVDTLAGHVPVYFASIATVMQQVKAGKLRALAVTSSKRSQLLPDVPTVDEALGIQGYELAATYGIFLPAKTPADIVNKLHDVSVKLLTADDFKKRIEKEGADGVLATTPAESMAFLKSEMTKFERIVRESGAKGK